jgi:hypothetical protein
MNNSKCDNGRKITDEISDAKLENLRRNFLKAPDSQMQILVSMRAAE